MTIIMKKTGVKLFFSSLYNSVTYSVGEMFVSRPVLFHLEVITSVIVLSM